MSLVVCAYNAADALVHQDRPAPDVQEPKKEKAMQVHYLEVVTPDVDATCGALEKMHGVSFSEPRAEFGNARTAALDGGGLASTATAPRQPARSRRRSTPPAPTTGYETDGPGDARPLQPR